MADDQVNHIKPPEIPRGDHEPDLLAKHTRSGDLAASEAHFREFFDCSQDVVLVVDSDSGRILCANAASKDLLLHESASLVGRHMSLLFPETLELGRHDSPESVRSFGGVLEAQEFRRADGSTLPMDLTATTIGWAGSPALLVTLRDASGRELLRSELEAGIARSTSELAAMHEMVVRAKNEWERTFDALSDLIMILDNDHKIVRLNKALAARRGVSPKQAVGRTCFEFVHGSDQPPDSCPLRSIVPGDREHSAEVYDPELGSTFDIRVFPLLGPDGSSQGWVHTARDITHRKQTEANLETELKKFRALYELVVAMTAEPSLDRNLALVVEKSRDLMGTDTAFVAMRDEAAGELYMATASGIRTESFRRFRVPFVPDLAGEVLGHRSARAVEDLLPGPEQSLEDFFEAEGIVSGLSAPIQVGNTNLGVLYAFNRARTSFTMSQFDTLFVLANLAAVEITRKRAEQGLQEALDDLERRVEARTAELREVNEKLLSEIAEREKVEQALRDSEEAARALLDATTDACLMLDDRGKILASNEKAARTFGMAVDQMPGKNIMDLLPPGLARDRRSRGAAAVRTGKPVRFVDVHRDTYVDNTIYPILSAVGKVDRLAVFLRDITERVQAEEQLRQAKIKADEANRAKSEFLANMSHELRTPLNSVIGFSEILEDQTFGPLNERQAKYIGHVVASGRHLLQLINDILDLAKVESGKMDLQPTEMNLKQLLENSLVMIREKAFRQKIRLSLQVADELAGMTIMADELKLKQIMYNLLSNAAKFTSVNGAIRVEAAKAGDEVAISVSDTGIGLKPEDHERIFYAFEQVDSSYSRQQRGTGLGLALTRRMVELHGGRIWVESEGPGSGATFRFTIPLTLAGA